MCLSRFGQIAYGALALAAVGLILVSVFTPGWRKIDGITSNSTNSSINLQDVKDLSAQLDMGLFGFTCGLLNNNTTIMDGNTPVTMEKVNGSAICEKWWENLSTSDKVVITSMILSLVAAIFAFVWNIMTFFACCFKGTIHKPLPALAGITAALLTVALIVFYTKNQQNIDHFTDLNNLVATLPSQGNVSYSFFVACGALACSVANVIVGTLIVCLADKCL